MNFALDAWAVVELLEGNEPAACRVCAVLEQQPVMSWISLGEVFYVVERDQGEDEALETLRDLRPKLDLDLPSEDRVLDAARIKAAHPMSYADAFAAATAAAHGAWCAYRCLPSTWRPRGRGDSSTLGRTV